MVSFDPHKAASTVDETLTNLLFDYAGAECILCSQDSYHFRVSRIYIVNSSPILGELIQRALGDANPETSLPIIPLPESGEILRCLLTFVFPVTPLLPSTLEKVMELLSVTQKYQMETALSHIRGSIGQQDLRPNCLEQALRVYALAQKYALRPEALQTARAIFWKQSMTIEDFQNKLDIMPGASLYELWKYIEGARAILGLDLAKFRMSCARGTITGLRCVDLSFTGIPSWLDLYIKSIESNPSLFDSAEFNIAMVRHVKDHASQSDCECASIPSQTIRNFWEALVSVIDGSFKKASVVNILCCLGVDPFTGRVDSISRARTGRPSSPNQFFIIFL